MQTVWTIFIATIMALTSTFSLLWKNSDGLPGHLFDMREGQRRQTDATGTCLIYTTGTRFILIQSCSIQMHNGYFTKTRKRNGLCFEMSTLLLIKVASTHLGMQKTPQGQGTLFQSTGTSSTWSTKAWALLLAHTLFIAMSSWYASKCLSNS